MRVDIGIFFFSVELSETLMRNNWDEVCDFSPWSHWDVLVVRNGILAWESRSTAASCLRMHHSCPAVRPHNTLAHQTFLYYPVLYLIADMLNNHLNPNGSWRFSTCFISLPNFSKMSGCGGSLILIRVSFATALRYVEKLSWGNKGRVDFGDHCIIGVHLEGQK